ncbi:MAG: DUF3604 domain-containing protein, partial [Gammaproteobacteria bacterium]|nr:DUF3604 domain-containing protein [Gammaproteobacteria bacterium]
MHHKSLILILTLLLPIGCSEQTTDNKAAETPPAEPVDTPVATATIASNADRQPYFGDVHVHTKLSFDAFIFGTRSTPDTAYEYAKGKPLAHPSGFNMQLEKPLDFLAVTDHAMYMGMLPEMAQPGTKAGDHPVSQAIREAKTPTERRLAFQDMFPYLRKQLDKPDDLLDMNVVQSAWQRTIEAAERHNQPGVFTTFVAYEYTATGPARENLHRNVIFKGKPASLPFSSMDSNNPEDLWNWMDARRGEGINVLAIPHNSNGSDGMMFALNKTDGSPFDAAYVDQRMRNEPLVEITQVKGTSDAHPLLSPNDEWADFEIMEYKIATVEHSKPQGSYVREAYGNGLKMAVDKGINPYRFGLIGSSDTHVGAGSFEEDNYWSKVGIVDGNAMQRGSVPLPEPDAEGNTYNSGPGSQYVPTWGASGLAGVWAESNTREAIYAAMERKETFASTGPRIPVRFFAGYGIADLMVTGDRISALYQTGVPMGGELKGESDPEGKARSPQFFVWATQDASSAPLQRLQIIKGWTESGETKEQVYDVACSDGFIVDPQTHRCPDNGATVNVTDCSINRDKGDPDMQAIWSDPDFDSGQSAFYYVRVLENPTCRWSTWDAIRAGVEPRESLKKTIQERAWSSPI